METEKGKRSVRANGNLIREARLSNDWSTSELGKLAGYSKRTIENAESGNPVDMRTLMDIAEALKLDYKSLLPAAESERKNLFRVQLLLECDIKEVASSRHLLSLLDLLMRLLPESEAIKLKEISLGSVLLSLEMDEGNAAALFTLFPGFHELARSAIAHTPEGRAYFKGEPHPGVEDVERLIRLVESVRELRIRTREFQNAENEAPEPTAPSDGGVIDPPLNPNEQYALEFVDLGDLVSQIEAAKSLPGPEREARVAELEKQLDAKFAALDAWNEKQK